MFFKTHLRRIDSVYRRIAGNDALIDFGEWKAALNVKNDVLAMRMFAMADKDHSGYVDKKEFECFALALLEGNTTARLNYVFNMCDMDENGFVGRDELSTIIRSSLEEQSLKLSDHRISELVTCFLEHAGVKRDKGINRQEFIQYLKSSPQIESQFDNFAYQLLGLSLRSKRKKIKSAGLLTRIHKTWLNRWKEQFWYLLYWGVNFALFTGAMYHYADQGASLAVQIARGGGACLNFNAALVLLPMCKSLHTWLRHTFLFRLFPLNNLTEVHIGIAYAIVAFSGIHILAHFVNYGLTEQALISVLLSTSIGVTGLVLSAVLLAMWYTGHKRRQHYQGFVKTHYLYAPFLVALLYHGPVFWLWMAPAILVFGADAAHRALVKHRKVEITELRSLSDRVTQVRFKRGRLFPFHPGDYIKVKIPEISSDQWHPFTLSAAPESTRLDVHARNNGDWSGALHNLANQYHCQPIKWQAYVDGPYGAPTSSIYRSPVAILIAGGIGVTPFASVLQSILLNNASQYKGKGSQQIIHFHWLNRTQQSYDWFLDLMAKAEKQLGDEHFFLNIHLTSLAKNLSNLVMQFAFDAYWKRFQKDPITDLHARTLAGRPNWDVIFSRIAKEYERQRVDIYFCGPRGLGANVRKMAFKHGLIFHEEKFE